MLALDNKSSVLRPLENEELTHSREFLRRYERMPHLKTATVLDGWT